MPKILCTLPNAGDEINGVKFSAVEGGMLSDEVSAELAETFLSIPGYVEHHEDADELARLAAEAAAKAQHEAEEAAKKAAAAKTATKAPARATKPAKAETVAPVAAVALEASVVEPEPTTNPAPVAEDDTTF